MMEARGPKDSFNLHKTNIMSPPRKDLHAVFKIPQTRTQVIMEWLTFVAYKAAVV